MSYEPFQSVSVSSSIALQPWFPISDVVFIRRSLMTPLGGLGGVFPPRVHERQWKRPTVEARSFNEWVIVIHCDSCWLHPFAQ